MSADVKSKTRIDPAANAGASAADKGPARAVHGVLLMNLGTPAAPRASAIRRWLKEFLSDPRVIEIPRLVWWPILNLFILPLRPYRLARNYKKIWTESGSPLLAISEAQAGKLRSRLAKSSTTETTVALAMRYGEPSIASALEKLSEQDVSPLTILPLYPQYSATTTASSIEAVVQGLRPFRNIPALRTIKDYHDHPAYIHALADSVKSFREAHGPGDHLLMSFHGLPQRNADLGDPYPQQCETTAALLADALQLRDDGWSLAYQSRFGKAQWLLPSTEDRLRALAPQCPVIDVICPGFAADCLETLEEINIQCRELYQELGGADLRYIPALNVSDAHIELLNQLVTGSCPDSRATTVNAA